MFIYTFIVSSCLHQWGISIEEAQEPQRYLVVVTHLSIITDVVGIGVHPYFSLCMGIADAELTRAVDEIGLWFAALTDDMVFPHRVDEKGLHDRLLVDGNGIDGVHQVGVVHHNRRRLLGEFFAVGVNHIQQACVGKILRIVHHRCTAGVNLMRQLTDIRRMDAIAAYNR